MRRPQFFEDLDKSLQGIDVEKLREAEEERRRQADAAHYQEMIRAQINVAMSRPLVDCYTNAPLNVALFPSGQERR